MEGLVYCERKKKISVYYANESRSAPCLANNSRIIFRLHQRRKIKQGRRRWYFRFFGFGFFLESFSWFCAKQSRRFSVLILRFVDFLFLLPCGFQFLSKILAGLRIRSVCLFPIFLHWSRMAAKRLSCIGQFPHMVQIPTCCDGPGRKVHSGTSKAKAG